MSLTPFDLSPFKGPDSFQRWEGARFFGRETDAERAAEMVLGSRVCVLHAPSGAGKTSFVNAALAPRLERTPGTVVAVARPGDWPSVEVQTAVLGRVFPSPSAEAAAIDRLIQLSGQAASYDAGAPLLRFDRTLSTAEALAQFAALRARPEAGGGAEGRVLDRRLWGIGEALAARTLAPALGVAPAVGAPRAAAVSSLFQRALDHPAGSELLARHLAAVVAWRLAGGESPHPPRPLADAVASGDGERVAAAAAEMSLGALEAMWAEPGLDAAWGAFVAWHMQEGTRLADFFARLAREWPAASPGAAAGRGEARPRIVVVLDQFEEMFTRFRGRDGLAARTAFFEELAEVVRAPVDDTGGEPVRLVLSMRDEHIAELGPIRAFAGDPPFHRLGFISPDQAARLIEGPAHAHGVTVEPLVVRTLTDAITRDDGAAEPLLAQIVCAHIWEACGEALARAARAGGQARLGPAELEALGSVEDILEAFVLAVVDGPATAPRGALERFELLSLLDSLVMSGDRRLITPVDLLLACPGRAGATRARMLEEAQARGLVRIEGRASGGAPAAEIMHERLLPAVTAAVVRGLRRDRDLHALDSALVTLSASDLGEARRSSRAVLSEAELAALDASAASLGLDPVGLEIAFRSALIVGERPQALARWAARLDAAGAPLDPDAKLASCETRLGEGAWLDRLELRALAANGWRAVGPAQAEYVLRSLMEASAEEDRGLIGDFAARVVLGQANTSAPDGAWRSADRR